MSKKSLKGKRAIVVGGSGSVGSQIVESLADSGAKVLAVGRNVDSLKQLQKKVNETEILAADITQQDVAQKLIEDYDTDIVVVSIGSLARMAPIQDLEWEEFTQSWNVDVKATFLLCKQILRKPLKSGATVIFISGGPGIGGSPLTGSLSGAKRMQLFMADFCQEQSERLNLGIRFAALVPRHIMPSTKIGEIGVSNYAKYMGKTVEAFTAGMSSPQSVEDVAAAVQSLLIDPNYSEGNNFIVTGDGLKSL